LTKGGARLLSERFQHVEEHIDDQMIKMEVNLDDMPGEWLGHLMDKLFEIGANDVYYTHIYMKKNRPAILLQVLFDQSLVEVMKATIFSETTTFGIRYYPIDVHRLARRFYTVQTIWGDVRIKQGLHQGTVIQNSPEYEDCLKISEKYKIPLKDVYYHVWKCLYK
jgi:pyridinium-3,5-bisthiocarboxylic acid mononucleotide nickel chelatase